MLASCTRKRSSLHGLTTVNHLACTHMETLRLIFTINRNNTLNNTIMEKRLLNMIM